MQEISIYRYNHGGTFAYVNDGFDVLMNVKQAIQISVGKNLGATMNRSISRKLTILSGTASRAFGIFLISKFMNSKACMNLCATDTSSDTSIEGLNVKDFTQLEVFISEAMTWRGTRQLHQRAKNERSGKCGRDGDCQAFAHCLSFCHLHPYNHWLFCLPCRKVRGGIGMHIGLGPCYQLFIHRLYADFKCICPERGNTCLCSCVDSQFCLCLAGYLLGKKGSWSNST